MLTAFYSIMTLTANVSALDFSVTAPDEASIDEEFTVTVAADTTEIYDVKVFAYSGSKSDYISQIWRDNAWKSPHFYLAGVFPGQTQFEVKITQGGSGAELCARMRKDGQSTYSEQCKALTITGAPASGTEEDEDEDADEENDASENDETEDADSLDDPTPAPAVAITTLSADAPTKLVLNAPTAEINKREEVTVTYKTRVGVIYAFIVFCVILVILLALRKL